MRIYNLIEVVDVGFFDNVVEFDKVFLMVVDVVIGLVVILGEVYKGNKLGMWKVFIDMIVVSLIWIWLFVWVILKDGVVMFCFRIRDNVWGGLWFVCEKL